MFYDYIIVLETAKINLVVILKCFQKLRVLLQHLFELYV